MPHTHFVCPDARMGGEVPIARCLEHARGDLWRECHWNHALLSMMVEEPDDRLSPTRLQQCARQVALKRRFPYALDPKIEYLKCRGTIFHAGLETLFGENNELELQRELVIADARYTINGRLDRLDGQVVADWKTKGYIRADMEVTPEHVGQLSVYAWLAEPKGLVCEWGEIMYLDMKKTKRFVVRLWQPKETEEWLRVQVPILQQAYDAQAPLPPPLDGRDEKGSKQNWRCRSCPVQKPCKEQD